MDELSDDEILADLPRRKPEKKVETKAKDERQFWVEQTATLLGISYPRVAAKVTGWPKEWIMDMYLYVKRPEVKNPAAMWNYLYKTK